MSVYVATPTTRAFDPLYVSSLLYMEKPEGMYWTYLNGMPIDISRNVLVESALKEPIEYVLFADSDATWAPGALTRLVSRNKDVITGCIYKRSIYPVPTFGRYTHTNEDNHAMYDFSVAMDAILTIADIHGLNPSSPAEVVLPITQRDLLKIDGCGLHFCLIHRRVFEKLPFPWFQCLSPGAGEDFYFCQKAIEAGFEIWADLSVHTGHIAGPGFVIGLNSFLAMYQSNSAMRQRAIWDIGLKV